MHTNRESLSQAARCATPVVDPYELGHKREAAHAELAALGAVGRLALEKLKSLAQEQAQVRGELAKYQNALDQFAVMAASYESATMRMGRWVHRVDETLVATRCNRSGCSQALLVSPMFTMLSAVANVALVAQLLLVAANMPYDMTEIHAVRNGISVVGEVASRGWCNSVVGRGS